MLDIASQVQDLSTFSSTTWRNHIVQDLNKLTPEDKQQFFEETVHYAKARLKKAEERLNQLFVGKSEIARMLIVSAIAMQPMLLLGPFGTAKTAIATRFCELLGIGRMGMGTSDTIFQYLLHSFTEPDELVGLLDLEAFRGGPGRPPRFSRLRDGSIIRADVVVLDEVFRANSAILNLLLSILNERRVYEGGTIEPARTRLIFGVANEPPKSPDLKAFYSRFIIRMMSGFVPMHAAVPPAHQTTPNERRELLKRGWAADVKTVRADYGTQAAETPVACLNDVLLRARAAVELWGAENLDHVEIMPFVDLFHDAVASIGGGSNPLAVIDDRRFIRLFAVARSHALFEGDNLQAPGQSDLCILKHVWQDKDHIDDLAAEVNRRLH